MHDKRISNVDLVRRSLSYLAKPVSERTLEDYQPFFETLAEDLVFEYASPGDVGDFVGKRSFVEYVTGLFSTLADPQATEDVELERPLEFFGCGDRVITIWRECSKDKATGETSRGKEVVVVIDCRDGLITRVRRFSQ